MNAAPVLSVLDHLWQSTAFAAAAGLLTLALRKSRARVRHGVWMAASVKFLVPLSLLIVAGSHLHWPSVQKPTEYNWSGAMVGVSEPFTAPIAVALPAPTNRRAAGWLPSALMGIWACGFLGIAGSWWVRWRRIAIAVHTASPLDLELPIPAMSSPAFVEPGVFGIFRPVLLLPAGIFERLTPEQRNTVIMHELCHVRHRDNLIAAFQMFVETAFWFHPLVWWIGKRMLEERERACDEGVLSMGAEPRVYAEAVLNVCKLCVDSPLRCVSGITGGNLKQRIEVIMTRRTGAELHVIEKFGLALAGMAAILAPVAIGMLHSPPAKAQSAPSPVALPAPVVTQESRAAAAQSPHPRRAPQEAPKFTNSAMAAAYAQYGPPDQIEDRNSDTGKAIQIWHYNFLKDYHGNVGFEFAPKAFLGARIKWPQQMTFEGGAKVSTAAPLLIQALNMDTSAMSGPTVAKVTSGFPGGPASIEPSVRLSPSAQLVKLSLPLDTLTGRVDVIVQFREGSSNGRFVANARDSIEMAAGSKLTYHTTFTLPPGSYVCSALVREQATGLMYTESIAFHLE